VNDVIILENYITPGSYLMPNFELNNNTTKRTKK